MLHAAWLWVELYPDSVQFFQKKESYHTYKWAEWLSSVTKQRVYFDWALQEQKQGNQNSKSEQRKKFGQKPKGA